MARWGGMKTQALAFQSPGGLKRKGIERQTCQLCGTWARSKVKAMFRAPSSFSGLMLPPARLPQGAFHPGEWPGSSRSPPPPSPSPPLLWLPAAACGRPIPVLKARGLSNRGKNDLMRVGAGGGRDRSL